MLWRACISTSSSVHGKAEEIWKVLLDTGRLKVVVEPIESLISFAVQEMKFKLDI